MVPAYVVQSFEQTLTLHLGGILRGLEGLVYI